jgi:DNA-directed RNA polymerase II subunit RPB2
MTISQLIETVVGKVCVLKGELGDGTPFSNSSKNVSERISKELQNQGYEGFGYETMYNGFTGKMLKAKIFIGPTYYQKLKHMISDKIHSRAKGDVTMLTRQPLAGRARYGGLKLGTMECEALIAQGISQFLREKTFDLSDTFHVLICNSCGNISNHKDECPSCFTKDLKLTKFPYASKLLFQQLQACGIKTKFHTQ